MKKFFVVFALIIALTAIAVFTAERNRESPLPPAENVSVAVSLYPLAEFAKQIGGEEVTVLAIVPPGVEPHDFEPTPQDIAKVYSAKIFLFNGSGFDPWAEKIAPELEKRGIAVVRMTQYFELLAGTDDDEPFDPHIWLDPILAKKEVEIIRDTLQKIDPANANVHEENAERYLVKLSELDRKYQQGLASCSIGDAVASHTAFGYLAKRYNINIVAIAGLSPEEEPSPKRIAEIAEFAREENIRHIFFETLVSPKLAETIAKEIGAKTLVFNPLEGLREEEVGAGKNYISIMEENLTNLRLALSCR